MVSIRKAVREDSPRLAELYTELEKDAVYYQPEHFVLSGGAARLTDEMFDGEGQAMFVAEEGGEVIGFAHVLLLKAKPVPCLRPQTNIYLQDLIVTESCRSRGIGGLLMSEVKKYGIESGADFLRTQVFPMNRDGLRFYMRNGFSETMITIECPLK